MFRGGFSAACLKEAIIGGLHAETTYSVTVAAYTTKGDGARSKAKVITTTGAGKSSISRPPHASHVGQRWTTHTHSTVTTPLCPLDAGTGPCCEGGLAMAKAWGLQP